ncbi:hypothetical protein [Streptomyces sp. NPDC048643]|uniref:hypothetical protein n=1 Tax=Streptomyces sp. NPDC048643 TaxID=3155637 RepID=UPI0034318107
MASLKPAHLKAMVAIGTDIDLYEQVAYNGGILNEEFFPHWYRNGLVPAVCGELDAADFLKAMRDTPTNTLYTGPRHLGYVQLPIVPGRLHS